MTDLNSLLPPGSGWALAIATAINKAGAIAGYGTINGQLHAFLMTSQMAVTASGLAYSRPTGTFNGTVIVTNNGASAVGGPLEVLFMGLTPGVTLVNATGSLSGTPYLLIPATASLAPSQSVTVSVQFRDPPYANISFIPAVYTTSVN